MKRLVSLTAAIVLLAGCAQQKSYEQMEPDCIVSFAAQSGYEKSLDELTSLCKLSYEQNPERFTKAFG